MQEVTSAESVEARLASLERLLGELIEHLGDEVKTRRVVVVEDDGFERVVAEGCGTHGLVTVAARRATPSGSTAVELYAHDESEGDLAHLGLALVVDGNVVRVVNHAEPEPA